MLKTVAFDKFWDDAVAAVKGCNGYCYHPCCDVWTTRSAIAKRDTHLKQIQWRKLVPASGKIDEQKKQDLLAKMNENGWQIPIVLNDSCKVQPIQTPQQQTTIQRHLPNIPPQDLQADPASLDFVFPGQLPFELTTPSSIHDITQTLDSLYSIRMCNPLKPSL